MFVLQGCEAAVLPSGPCSSKLASVLATANYRARMTMQ